MTDEYPLALTSTALARKLGVSKKTIARIVKRGQLKPLSCFGNHLFSYADVVELLKSKKK